MLQYLIRLDDLCPTNSLPKWERFFTLLDHFNIKPIVAVIPQNKDPKLEACGAFNPFYWDLVRELQQKNYTIGMHGYDHRYINNESGLLKMNKRSEFAGLPYIIQEKKISAAALIFERESIHAKVFIAPAHSFDRNTLLAISRCTDIKTISDGILKSPYRRFGFNWVPVQLAEAEQKKTGVWTFNYHPETCTEKVFRELEVFIENHKQYFVSPEVLQFKAWSWHADLTEKYLIYKRLLRDTIKNVIAEIKK